MGKLLWIALTKEWPTSIAGTMLIAVILLKEFGYISADAQAQIAAIITAGGLIASKSVKKGDSQ